MSPSSDGCRDHRIAVVIVLYGMGLHDSTAASSLQSLPSDRRQRLRLMVWDNSSSALPPTRTALTPDHYVADASNPGLARAYNAALGWATTHHCEWLLLLDQDTEVTVEYVDAVLAFTHGLTRSDEREHIGVAFPQLTQGAKVLSPTHYPRIGASAYPRDREVPPTERVMVLNSGAVVSVRAMSVIGGFPESYPLDALDHAFIATLRQHGYRFHPLAVRLEHHASTSQMALMPNDRFRSIATAEDRFFAQFGTVTDRLWLTARRLVRLALVVLRRRETPSLRSELTNLASAFRVLVNWEQEP